MSSGKTIRLKTKFINLSLITFYYIRFIFVYIIYTDVGLK